MKLCTCVCVSSPPGVQRVCVHFSRVYLCIWNKKSNGTCSKISKSDLLQDTKWKKIPRLFIACDTQERQPTNQRDEHKHVEDHQREDQESNSKQSTHIKQIKQHATDSFCSKVR